MPQGLEGVRIAVFESRRATELGGLVERWGGTPVIAPTMKEVPLTPGPELTEFVASLRAGCFDVVLLLTGVGTRALATALDPILPKAELAALLGGVRLGARGPKTVAALKELSITRYVLAPEPHEWTDLLAAMRAEAPLSGARVAVQEYGVPHPELVRALEAEGCAVTSVPVYRWHLPDDLAPLEDAITRACDGTLDAAFFTSANQADHLLEIARRMGREDTLRAALARMFVGSIGPTCSARLRTLGLAVDLEPTHAKMGHLVKETAERFQGRGPRSLDDAKRPRATEAQT